MKKLALFVLLLCCTLGAMAQITGPNHLCVGSTIALTDTLAGGPWTSSNTVVATVVPSNGHVTGLSAGTSVISYARSGGGFDFYTVTVNPLPPAITGSILLCSGDIDVLSDAAPGGTWSSSSSCVSVVSGSGVVTGIFGPCTAQITYTLITGCTATYNLSVLPSPKICTLTGGGGYCPGMPCPDIDLGCSEVGVNYQVYACGVPVGGPVAGTGAALSFGSIACGPCAYTVIATNVMTGCTTNMNGTIHDTLLTPCVITGRTSICVGDTSTLSGCSGCSWSSSMPTVATVGSCDGIVTGISAGTANITYTSSKGCISILRLPLIMCQHLAARS